MANMIDLERLWQPIAPADPTGPNLRLLAGDLTLQQIAALCQEVDPLADPDGMGRRADWPEVVRRCEVALSERSKDLELAARLSLALVRTEGLAGLRAGLQVLRELTMRFWDRLHPGAPEEGDEQVQHGIRARWLSWVGSSGEFLRAVKQMPLVGAIGGPAYGWHDFQESRRVEQAAMKSDRSDYNELIAAGLISGQQWQDAVAATPTDRLASTLQGLTDCLEELAALRAVCAERFIEDAPWLEPLEQLLGECRDHLRAPSGAAAVAGGAGAAGAATGPAPAVVTIIAPAVAGATAGLGAAVGQLQTREQAYRALRDIAAFLRRLEPHSPVPLLIDRAVKWGDLGFDALFQDVVQSDEARRQVQELLGLRRDDE